jgi:dimethylamine/trimethylamine dehydrogenase
VLVVGAGPAGLEAARALGQRGYEVMLAEASRELGGRVALESRLPGLSEWARVRDYRVQQIQRMANVQVFLESRLDAKEVMNVGADHVVIATGATWRRDGLGRFHPRGITGIGPADRIFTPDDIMAGRLPMGRVLVFDDDHYYMGAVLAERFHATGAVVTMVTPDDKVAAWGTYTAEQTRTQRRLLNLGVTVVTAHGLCAFDGAEATIVCAYTGREQRIAAESLVLVTARQPNDSLFLALSNSFSVDAEEVQIKTLRRIGDCDAPAIIAAAVYAGHRCARELDAAPSDRARVPRDGGNI